MNSTLSKPATYNYQSIVLPPWMSFNCYLQGVCIRIEFPCLSLHFAAVAPRKMLMGPELDLYFLPEDKGVKITSTQDGEKDREGASMESKYPSSPGEALWFLETK